MSEFIKTDLDLHAEDIRSQIRECRDPERMTRLNTELHTTMQRIADSRPAHDHSEELQALRDNGQTGSADLLERQTRISAAQARLDTAGSPRELEAAEKALQTAQAPTDGQLAPFERRRLYDEANELSTTAALLKRSPLSEERVRGDQMAEDAEEKMQQFYETRVEV